MWQWSYTRSGLELPHTLQGGFATPGMPRRSVLTSAPGETSLIVQHYQECDLRKAAYFSCATLLALALTHLGLSVRFASPAVVVFSFGVAAFPTVRCRPFWSVLV